MQAIRKSPSAPSRTLEFCLEETRKVYDAVSHAAIGKGDIAGIIGMSAKSGPFGGLMASLKQYGLLTGEGGGLFSVSQSAKDYFATPSGDTASLDNRRVAFIEGVDFFRVLLADFGDKVPSPNNLESILMSKYMFNKARASVTAKVFFESLSWAGKIDSKGNILSGTVRNPCAEAGLAEDGAGEGLLSHFSGPACDDRIPGCVAEPGYFTVQVPLKEGRRADISYPCDLEVAEAKKIGLVLEALSGDGAVADEKDEGKES